MAQHRKHLVFGLGTWGVGQFQPTLWRDPRIPTDASVSLAYYREWARRAEAARLDFLFLADSQHVSHQSPPHELNRLEPFTLLSALAAVTERIGLVLTASTSYNSPYNIARRIASLDLLSGGRAGWNVVATRDNKTALNFGRAEHYDHDTRYRRALEHVSVVQGLWDSYEDGAFPADVEQGVYFDPAKLHALDHHGEFFDVVGPIAVGRSPQGQPVIFQAGGSDQGRDFAARVAEGAFGKVDSKADALAYAHDLKRRATREHGRHEAEILFLPWLTPVIADTDHGADELARQHFAEDYSFPYLLELLGRDFNWHDFSVYDLDGPFPVDAVANLPEVSPRGRAVVEDARAQGWTLREAAKAAAGAESYTPPLFTGSAETVAREFADWFEVGALDGAKLVFRTFDDLDAFTSGVLPLLRDRGLYRDEYDADTLRGHLRLDVPTNRYTAARTA